jgi:hypothetical protein
MFFWISFLFTPFSSKLPRNAIQDGSTFFDVNPWSASYPICETWTKEPVVGPDIIDLSILPPLPIFFFFSELGVEVTPFPFLIFLKKAFASFSSANTRPIIHSCVSFI